MEKERREEEEEEEEDRVERKENPKKNVFPHCLSIQEIFEEYKTTPDGLSEKEAKERHISFGSNTILKDDNSNSSSLLWRFFLSFKEPLIALLIASSLVSFLVGQVVDGLSILTAICFVNLMALWQEYKSEKSLEALSKMAISKCNVKRGDSVRVINSESLVLGDVVLLSAGDRVPADIRIINNSQLSLDESLLTGESKPVSKSSITLPLSESARPISEKENIGYMGTTVVMGRGTGVVVGIGQETELGNISQMIQEMEAIRTPLQEKMDQIGKDLSFLALGIIVIILLVGVYQQRPFLSMLNIAISLAVAAIPEGLPIVVTITLAIGVTRMAYRHVIVRSLPIVEGLGGTTVICTDKTGTLTKNQMTAEYLVTEETYKIEEIASWRKPNSSSSQQYEQINVHLERILHASILCNNAVETREGHYVGQPTEVALLRLSKKFDIPDIRKWYTRLSEDPFTSETKMMSTEYEISGQKTVFVKGAVERVLSSCNFIFSSQSGKTQLSPEIRLKLLEQADNLGSKALRVLAMADKTGSEPMTFLGLVGIRDPLKEGVVEAFQKCFSSKIQVIILTGDSKETAEAIAAESGVMMGGSRCSMSAEELDRIPESLLSSEIGRVGVFYRVTPAHKLKIVNSLIAADETVAMTGDGVNDAPALKRAHIGVAMGQTGSEVAKEAAQMILLDDNFASIYAAILEGKAIFNNILSFLRYQLTTSLSCLLVVFLSSVLDLPPPMNPTQILWINILMDGPPAQSLGMEPLDPNLANAPPRHKSESIFSKKLLTEVFIGVSVMTVGTLALFKMEMNDITSEDEEIRARTIAFNTFVLFQIFNAFNCKSHSQTFFRKESAGNYFFWVALLCSLLMQMGALYAPFLQLIFQTTPLTFSEFMTSAMVASTVLIVDEIGKMVVNRTRSMSSKDKLL